jgi:endonuclease-3
VCALTHRNAYELLTATILSAQCTDERVNAVTPVLFAAYPTPGDLAESCQEDVERIIHSLGFFRAKAENIRGMARQLVDDFQGELPRTVEEMTALPGVGRKTANVVLGTWYGLATGVVVDTHVKRISRLLGLTTSANPEIIERELKAVLPQKEWINYSHRVITHGRRICIARRPRCQECPLLKVCLRVGLPPLQQE